MGQIRHRLIKIDMSIVYRLHVYIFLSIFTFRFFNIHITFFIHSYIYIYVERERESFITLTHVYCVAGCFFFFPKHSSKKARGS